MRPGYQLLIIMDSDISSKDLNVAEHVFHVLRNSVSPGALTHVLDVLKDMGVDSRYLLFLMENECAETFKDSAHDVLAETDRIATGPKQRKSLTVFLF